MVNERDSVHISLEAILLLLYAWNLCHVPDMDLSRSMVAVGRGFTFPVDYSAQKHWELTSSPTTVLSYSKHLAVHLSACREVAELLVTRTQSWHRKFINSCRRDPGIFKVANIVFACRAVKSGKNKGRVDKFKYLFA